jgi:microcystin-dependent protein
MTTVYLAPIFNAFNVATTGWLPLDGGKIYTYLSETETPAATWTTADGDVENDNPIILGVDGRPPDEIWLESGVAYTFVLKDSLDNTIGTYDNLAGINDVSASTATIAVQDEGVAQGNASTFNFVGGSVSAGVSGSVATITVTSASGTLAAGDIVPSGARTRSGALLCDGTAYSRATYATLFAAIVPSLGTFTVTIATPAVFSLTSHGLTAGDKVYFTTTGALPTGLSVNTIYYVISAGLTSSAFEVSATSGGSAINTTGTQSGTHTLRFCPYGLGNGSTTFNVPDLRGQAPIGSGTGSGLTARQMGVTGGAETITLTGAQSGTSAHTHTATGDASGSLPYVWTIDNLDFPPYVDAGLMFGNSNTSGSARNTNDVAPNHFTQPLIDLSSFTVDVTVDASSAASASQAHANMQPFNVVNYFIITG